VKILRGGEVLVPGGQTAIRADDVMFVLTDIDQARTIEHLVNPTPAGVR
jgi:Trk K+ transport system NAD-binding subunit